MSISQLHDTNIQNLHANTQTHIYERRTERRAHRPYINMHCFSDMASCYYHRCYVAPIDLVCGAMLLCKENLPVGPREWIFRIDICYGAVVDGLVCVFPFRAVHIFFGT